MLEAHWHVIDEVLWGHFHSDSLWADALNHTSHVLLGSGSQVFGLDEQDDGVEKAWSTETIILACCCNIEYLKALLDRKGARDQVKLLYEHLKARFVDVWETVRMRAEHSMHLDEMWVASLDEILALQILHAIFCKL